MVHSNGMSTTLFNITKKVQLEKKIAMFLVYSNWKAVHLNIRIAHGYIHNTVKERTNLHDRGKFEVLNYREQHFQKDLPLVTFPKTMQSQFFK